MSSAEGTSWSEHPDLVAFYQDHRNSPQDLYPSERRFLPWLARQESVLDVGCAAGGFSNVWRHYNPRISYVGVDVSSSLIEAARRFHPDLEFHHGDCADGLPLPERFAKVVAAMGWLHWEPRYAEAIKELWRLADRFLFFDVRLAADAAQAASGKQQVAFAGTWDGKTTTPYVTVAWPHFAAQLLELRPNAIMAHGYWGKPADTVMDINEQVCFAAFVLERNPAAQFPTQTTVCLDLPFAWPETSSSIQLLPSAELESLIPQL